MISEKVRKVSSNTGRDERGGRWRREKGNVGSEVRSLIPESSQVKETGLGWAG